MNTLSALPAIDQFIVLKQFIGTDKQPYKGVPGPVLLFRVYNPKPVEPHVADVEEMLTPPTHRIDLRHDDRVRFTPQGAEVKTEPRTCRPWLQAHPAAKDSGACIVRLTSEGRRRLALLNDLIETQQQPRPSVSELITALS